MPVRPLSKELQRKAINELNEDPKRIQNYLQLIREWAKKQPHLKLRTDDQTLLNVLRGCRYDLELVKEKLDLLCTLKSVAPELFDNRDPFLPEIQELLKLGICVPLRKAADPAAPRVILLRVEPVDLIKIQAETVIKLVLMIMDILLNEDDNCVVAGGHLFIDNKGISMNHIMQAPVFAQKFYKCLNDAYAVRPQGFHAVNSPQHAEVAFNMAKSVLGEEVLNLIHFYNDNNSDELYQSIPLSILPEEYGGDGGSLDDLIVECKKKVESYRNWFLEDAQYCSDETKRPGKPKTSASLFGSGAGSSSFNNIMELD